ncbi:sugar transferase [Actibacterium ureilyticum]|uniref:sugar transferase n=1 Tax=Actibacterium ureilyticum TaxID=1590614 RepID=UPI000BAAA9CC
MRGRVIDIALAALLAILLLPVLAVLLAILWAVQGRPLFHMAERMRTPTHAFPLIKLRTMHVSATDHGVSGGDKHARITPIGRWLRRYRLDEIPQLWNILRGDMGFVGPRPPLRDYVDRFPALYGRVLRTRPGLTGLATLVFHRHEGRLLAACMTAEETDAVYCRVCIPRKARLDLIHARHRSPGFDLWILWRTVQAVLGRKRIRPARVPAPKHGGAGTEPRRSAMAPARCDPPTTPVADRAPHPPA